MASQQDMFQDSQKIELRKKARRRKCSSLDPSRKSHEYMYEFVVLFNWDPNLRKPFQSFKLSTFNSKDFKNEWIEKNLGIASRTTKLTNLSPFPGGTYSLFAKLELGVEDKHRNEIVADFNSRYFIAAASSGTNVAECLRIVAESTPYRYFFNLFLYYICIYIYIYLLLFLTNH